ncbi:pilus assembly protein [Glycomyces sp. L485]|uniref:TadE family protein n=1 Tax=Glycomyces sp. L485 TaxID=2909235 RepID=UPI001F4A1457|nr:TadE family protein [Glycomyces sp. L485]MCH7229932.1 pilus assembly protein [Glycomyces sp. L485]
MNGLDADSLSADDGSATVEFVIAVPALMLMLLIVVQAGIWGIATYTAHAAAGEAVTELRASDGTAATAAEAAAEAVADLGGGLDNLGVTAERDGQNATVTLTGTAPALIPGLGLPVEVTQDAPVEERLEDEAP